MTLFFIAPVLAHAQTHLVAVVAVEREAVRRCLLEAPCKTVFKTRTRLPPNARFFLPSRLLPTTLATPPTPRLPSIPRLPPPRRFRYGNRYRNRAPPRRCRYGNRYRNRARSTRIVPSCAFAVSVMNRSDIAVHVLDVPNRLCAGTLRFRGIIRIMSRSGASSRWHSHSIGLRVCELRARTWREREEPNTARARRSRHFECRAGTGRWARRGERHSACRRVRRRLSTETPARRAPRHCSDKQAQRRWRPC